MKFPVRALRWIPLLSLAAWYAFGSPLAAEVAVSLSVAGQVSGIAPAEILIVAEPLDLGQVQAGEEFVEYAVEPGRWLLDLPAGLGWRLRAEAPGFWGNTVEVETGFEAGEVELRLWRSGWLRGELGAPAEAVLPEELALQLEGDVLARESGEPQAVTVRCPVVEGSWECAIPAGEIDLVVAAEGFLPQAPQKVLLEPDQTLDLGRFELAPAVALAGRVELEDGGVPSGECEVRLEAFRRGSRSQEDWALASVAADGSFAFPVLPAGSYELTASQPGYLPAIDDSIEIVAGESLEIPEPLVLRLPAALELVFSPPVAPEGRSWRFEVKALEPGDYDMEEVIRGEANPDGTWFQEDLVPGPYEISLAETVGDEPVRRRVVLPSGWSTVTLELAVVQVEGYVSAGGEPLAAKLTFSRPEGKLSTTFDSDAAGLFSGLLPGEGRWLVQVEAPDEGLSRTLDEVEVWSSGGSGVAVVEVGLPGTVLEGEVTDMLGNPQAEATLTVRRPGLVEDSQSFQTDTDGWFRIRGLEPGAVTLTATAGNLRSQNLDVVLYEDRPGPALRIVVR